MAIHQVGNELPETVALCGSRPTDVKPGGKEKEDLTGRDRLVSNVLYSWGTYLVFIVAGFIMPRMIDRRLGQDLLGIWDFAWSLVSYFELIQTGIGSSVSRYVARCRAMGDAHGVNCIVSSATCLLGVGTLLVMGLTVLIAFLLPQLFGERLGESVIEAQWVVLFLGASLCARILLGAFNGVLTGCHCWALHNINTSVWHAMTVAWMVLALLLGGGLWMLAAIVFVGEVLAGVTRTILAYRICEHLRLRPSFVRWQTIADAFVFGGKTLLPSVSQILLNQATSILIVGYLGPAALALYMRPQSLIRHVTILTSRMATILTPTASALQSAANLEGIQELLLTSVRYSFYMAAPIVLVLIVFGGPVMQLWMGPHYADGLVPAILAAGFLMVMVQTPVRTILAGLNAHGRAGMGELVASVGSIVAAVLALGTLRWGLAGIALAITLPLALMNIVYLPVLIRRHIGLPVTEYFLSVAVKPAVHILPFAACLAGARVMFHARPLIGLISGGLAGTAMLAAIYWRYVLPNRIKIWVFGSPRKLMQLTGLSGAGEVTG